MCTGLELALIGGAATSAVSQFQGASTQSKLLEREAALGKASAAFEESQLRKRGVSLAGSQRVAAAKSGVTQTGSILDVMRQTAEDVELEALNIQFGAEASSQARLFEAKQIKRAAPIQAASTLLSGFGTLGPLKGGG